MRLLEGVKPIYGIFTVNKEFADKVIDSYIKSHKIPVSKRIKSSYENYAVMEDGTKYKWIKPNNNARGNKCSAGIIDLATCSFDFIREWIPSICIFAEKSDYIFKDSEFGLERKPYDLHTLIDRLQKIEVLLGNVESLGFYDMDYGWQILVDLGIETDKVVFGSYC